MTPLLPWTRAISPPRSRRCSAGEEKKTQRSALRNLVSLFFVVLITSEQGAAEEELKAGVTNWELDVSRLSLELHTWGLAKLNQVCKILRERRAVSPASGSGRHFNQPPRRRKRLPNVNLRADRDFGSAPTF